MESVYLMCDFFVGWSAIEPSSEDSLEIIPQPPRCLFRDLCTGSKSQKIRCFRASPSAQHHLDSDLE
jgi:hypothetical protein